MKLDNIGFAVSDLAVMADFFAHQLGLDVQRSGGALQVRMGQTHLYVFETGRPKSPETGLPDATLADRRAGLDHLSFEVEDVDASYAALQGRGVHFLHAPRTRSDWGLRVAPFVDPEGNLYFLITHLT